jgi:hypothetical protein
MAKVKLSDKVKNLINAHQYDEAITLLATKDSPRATDWIRRIEAQRAAYVRQSQRQSTKWLLLSVFGCIAACSVYLWFAS